MSNTFLLLAIEQRPNQSPCYLELHSSELRKMINEQKNPMSAGNK